LLLETFLSALRHVIAVTIPFERLFADSFRDISLGFFDIFVKIIFLLGKFAKIIAIRIGMSQFLLLGLYKLETVVFSEGSVVILPFLLNFR
jgi:hypothetical protein